MKRKNFCLDEKIVERLEQLSEYYGVNQTAMISILTTNEYERISDNLKK